MSPNIQSNNHVQDWYDEIEQYQFGDEFSSGTGTAVTKTVISQLYSNKDGYLSAVTKTVISQL